MYTETIEKTYIAKNFDGTVTELGRTVSTHTEHFVRNTADEYCESVFGPLKGHASAKDFDIELDFNEYKLFADYGETFGDFIPELCPCHLHKWLINSNECKQKDDIDKVMNVSGMSLEKMEGILIQTVADDDEGTYLMCWDIISRDGYTRIYHDSSESEIPSMLTADIRNRYPF